MIFFTLFSLQLTVALALRSRLVYQFPNDTFVENIAARSNGKLLLTIINSPTLYSLDPTTLPTSPSLLYTFPNATSVTGITEIHPDIFAIAVGNFIFEPPQGIPGSWGIWLLDVRKAKAVVTKLVSAPEWTWLNGLTTLSPGIALVSDSALGAVWAIDVVQKKYRLAIQDAAFLPTPNATFPIGINGIRIGQKSKLYFVNSAEGIYGRVPVNGSGFATGPVDILARATETELYDDFALDHDDTAWIATRPNAIHKVTKGGLQTVIKGENGTSSELVGPNSGAFGRGSDAEKKRLYVPTESGQLVVFETL